RHPHRPARLQLDHRDAQGRSHQAGDGAAAGAVDETVRGAADPQLIEMETGLAGSPGEATEQQIQRIDLHNQAINAIVWQDRDRAMSRARRADEALTPEGHRGLARRLRSAVSGQGIWSVSRIEGHTKGKPGGSSG